MVVISEMSLRSIPSWTYVDAFTSEECDQIVAYCKTFQLKTGGIVSGQIDGIRASDIVHITPSDANEWIIKRMNEAIVTANETYQFKLTGYDSFQYGEYDAEKEGHYDFHTDNFWDVAEERMRKLSLSLILNDDYEGGMFQIQVANEPILIPQKKGRVLIFPSFVLHGVTEVYSGVRKSIVVWVKGPHFE